ncbi:BTB/POZ domain-containing protein [Dorcoceras hygrometricum]|uniref:BTB/POZ domain-containing protein n=1 Tax=Dorcoceras hygrometricum TaxID=472368 RepID=A0A2Z7DBQ6_9LAMI|nr:BTB/POZ domain-containing protein [Dorcoceras hygrometricum]
MPASATHNPHRRKPPSNRGRNWCCSFVTPPLSPEKSNFSRSHSSSSCSKKMTELPSSSKLPLSRWILSPGRVSPISDNPVNSSLPQKPLTQYNSLKVPLRQTHSGTVSTDEVNSEAFDVRLNLKGKNGGSLILELGSEVLIANSPVFADLISDYRRNQSGLCRIEVPDVENLNVFRETIGLMFEDDIQKKLLNVGVFRAINILEVSAGIKFTRGVSSCLRYLEAVPWADEEEEKLRQLCAKLDIDDVEGKEISERITGVNCADTQQTMTKQLIWCTTTCTDTNARNELKSLVKGLLSESSIYKMNTPDVNKNHIFSICESCMGSLTILLEEALDPDVVQKSRKTEKYRPLLERISQQVDNLNWLLDILLEHQMAEEFMDLWTNQQEVLKMHQTVSPMIRYELSRVSAMLFIAMGSRKLHCRPEARLAFLNMWFRPMLSDFGWLQRCRKGLDMKALEEAMGQVLLTLPLKEQYSLFVEWLPSFSKNGTECPNLSKAFEIWWRRSFVKGSGASAIEHK